MRFIVVFSNQKGGVGKDHHRPGTGDLHRRDRPPLVIHRL